MKIRVTLEMEGSDQWTHAKAGGEVEYRRFEIATNHDDTKCQLEMVADALGGLILSLEAPRNILLAATLANGVGLGEPFNEVEQQFLDSADDVIRFWREIDNPKKE